MSMPMSMPGRLEVEHILYRAGHVLTLLCEAWGLQRWVVGWRLAPADVCLRRAMVPTPLLPEILSSTQPHASVLCTAVQVAHSALLLLHAREPPRPPAAGED